MFPATRSPAQLFFWYVNLQGWELVLRQVGSSVGRFLSFIVLFTFLVGPSSTVSFGAWPLPFSRLGSHRCPSRSLFFSRLARFVDRLFERPSSIRLVSSWPAFCTPGFLVLPRGQAVSTAVSLPPLPWHSRLWRLCLGPVLPPSFDRLFRRPRSPSGRFLACPVCCFLDRSWPADSTPVFLPSSISPSCVVLSDRSWPWRLLLVAYLTPFGPSFFIAPGSLLAGGACAFFPTGVHFRDCFPSSLRDVSFSLAFLPGLALRVVPTSWELSNV